VIEQILNSFAQTGVGLDYTLVELLVALGIQFVHQRLAVLLMIGEPLAGIHLEPARQFVVMKDLLEISSTQRQ